MRQRDHICDMQKWPVYFLGSELKMLVGATIYAARGHLDLVVKAPDAGGRFVEN